MEITDVRVHLRQGEDHLKAFVSVILDGAFAVEDLKVVDGARGLFVSMPRRKLPDGTYRDVAHAVTKEMREALQTRVLAVYQQALEGTASG
ncbi:MAG: SpoVG family protein [Candidatus Coatesbacteria bacterium]